MASEGQAAPGGVRVARVVTIHAAAPAKPALGEPCNGCGVCCASEPCPVGVLVSRRRRGGCRALQWQEDQRIYRCGVVREPQQFLPWLPAFLLGVASRLARRWISAGSGCDCDATVQRA